MKTTWKTNEGKQRGHTPQKPNSSDQILVFLLMSGNKKMQMGKPVANMTGQAS